MTPTLSQPVSRDRGLICLSATGGTLGDIRPLIALALALRARGFDILLFGDVEFERAAASAGVAASEWCNSCDVPQGFYLRTTAGQRWLWNERARLRDLWLKRELAAHRASLRDRFLRRAGGPNNPRIVAVIGSISAADLLLKFGRQCAKIISCPIPLLPSQHFTLAAPDLSLVERIRHRIVRRRWIAKHGRRLCDEVFHLVSASPMIFPRPVDWPSNGQVTGYLPLDRDFPGWSAPADLTAVLEAGPPPVCVGFGSLPMFVGARGARLAREIVEGCRRCDRRCVIQSPDLPDSVASERVFTLRDPVPHAWLFPRCAAIVHHGGYGTVHAALIAKRPMIVYPFQADEFLWAARMGELKIGPGFTARLRAISAERVALDLASVLRPECEARAAVVAAAIREEQGLPNQVAAIESIIEHTRRGRRPAEWRMPAFTPAHSSDAVTALRRL